MWTVVAGRGFRNGRTAIAVAQTTQHRRQPRHRRSFLLLHLTHGRIFELLRGSSHFCVEVCSSARKFELLHRSSNRSKVAYDVLTMVLSEALRMATCGTHSRTCRSFRCEVVCFRPFKVQPT